MNRIASLTLLALGALAPAASAQIVVQGVRDLDFGVVLPGLQTSVLATDPIQSGQYYFSTPALGTRVRIRFDLPSQLDEPGGASMPITFKNNDAMIEGTAPASPPVFFNPNANTNLVMTTSRDANIWLGGTVSPVGGQAVGTYTAPVVVTITIF